MPRASKRIARRGIEAGDLYRLELPVSVAMSPDESRAVYIRERIDRTEQSYRTNLWMIDLDRNSEHQFTFGEHSDDSPVWSPDGHRIAFLSSRDKKQGIYVMPADGGSEEKLIELDGAVSHLTWTPAADVLIFALRYNDSHFVTDEKKKKAAPVYRHITRLFYRLDGMGFLPKDTFQIYELALSSKRLRRITKGKRDNRNPSLSPDGKLIAYVSNRAANQDVDILRDDLFVIPRSGGRERRIPTPAGPIDEISFSPNGKWIAFMGHDNPDDAWGVTNTHIWRVGTSGRDKAIDLMPRFDRMTFDGSISDMGEVGGPVSMAWSRDSKRVFFLSSDTGNTNLFSVPVTGGKPTRLFRGDCHIRQFSVNGKTATAALVVSDLTTPGKVITAPTGYMGEKKALIRTRLNGFLKNERKLSPVKEIRFRAHDGTDLQGWLVVPPDFVRSKRFPAILQIHGGPRVQYAFSFFHEMQYLAACGYVVFYTNPRGGHGRGETWAASISGGWGDIDYADCMAAADWLAKQPFVNEKRMGVGGGSYGGYMTNWIIGHTDRFAAAVTMRSVVDLNSFVGSSDLGWTLAREFDGFPWTNPENYAARSPMTYFHKVKTPVLILHNEQDLRCHIEQAEQMFVKLKMLKKTVEMVRFPEEPHGLSRHGRPDRRVARLEWIRKWFDRYLKK